MLGSGETPARSPAQEPRQGDALVTVTAHRPAGCGGLRARSDILGLMASERWWSARRAQSRKPATYRCPLCGRYLPALSEHMLVVPEDDASRRRHAHTECVIAARGQGRLLTKREWLHTQAPPRGPWRRAIDSLARLTGPRK